MLGVSRASAGEMLKRLEADGLSSAASTRRRSSPPTGRSRAERVVRKHRIIERLLTDFMGYTPPSRTCTPTSSATRSPTTWSSGSTRGSATPSAARTAGRSTPTSSRPRTRSWSRSRPSRPGSDATIVRLAEHDGDLLHWFYDEGLVPGVEFHLAAVEAAAGQFRVRLDGSEKAIGEKAAAGLYVRPAA